MKVESLFNIDVPIVQAPMAGASNPDLAAAVSNAGGLGSLGAAAMKPDYIKAQIREIRGRTDKPFNINLFAPASEQFNTNAKTSTGLESLIASYHEELELGGPPEPQRIFGPAEDQLALLIEEKVPVISFHFGIEKEHVDAIHDGGLLAICSATTVKEAMHLEELGVDAIIAQGSEAGGHRGTFIDANVSSNQDTLIGTLALVPQIVDAVNVPVIAAGGIMDARGIVATRALGADAVQIGTAFLGCPETKLTKAWLKKLRTTEAEETTVTRAMSGKPARGIRNRYITEVEALDGHLLPYPLQYSLSRKLRQEAAKTDNTDFLSMWSGQGVGLLQELPAAELMHKLIAETKALAQSIKT